VMIMYWMSGKESVVVVVPQYSTSAASGIRRSACDLLLRRVKRYNALITFHIDDFDSFFISVILVEDKSLNTD